MRIRDAVKILSMVCLMAAIYGSLDGVAIAGRQTPQQGREVHRSFDLNPGGTVSVSNMRGHISVTSWNENRVQVDAVKTGGRDEDQDLVEIQFNAVPDRLEILTIYTRGRSGNVSVDYDIKVPQTAVLSSLNSNSSDISVAGPVARVSARSTSGNIIVRNVVETATLTSSSGTIRAEKVGGELRTVAASGNIVVSEAESRLIARTASGSVTATRVRDEATIYVSSGPIRLEKIGGRTIARTNSGPITMIDITGDAQAESLSDNLTIEAVSGRLTAKTLSGNVIARRIGEGVRASSVSGRIDLDDVKGRVEVNTTSENIILNNISTREVLAKTTNGNVNFSGSLFPDGHYELSSFNGNVTLVLPAESSFRITARSQSGSVNTEFPVQMGAQTQPERGLLTGVVGNGGAEIVAASFNGNVMIKKSGK